MTSVLQVRKLASIRLPFVALLFCLLCLSLPVCADSYTYTLFDLPANSGSGSIYMRGINDLDQIVGVSNGQGFLYSDGVYSNLQGYPVGINNEGIVAGSFPNQGAGAVTTYTYSNGAYTSFSVPNQDPNWPAYPYGINNAGTVVGTSGMYYGTRYGFTYNGSTFTSFVLPGSVSTVYGINDAGTIVGQERSSGDFGSGLIVANNSFTEVDYPFPTIYGARDTNFSGINNSGQILGYADYNAQTTGYPRVQSYFIYSNGNFTDLNLPTHYQPTAINDNGQLLGTVASSTGAIVNGFIATPTSQVPEIDPNSGASAIGLLAGVLLILRGRQGTHKRSMLATSTSGATALSFLLYHRPVG